MATLPPILVELRANSSELTAKLGEIQGEFQKTASEGQSMASKIKDHFGAVSTAVGGTLAGAGAALSALGSKDQAAQQQLRQSIENTGKSYEDYKDNIERNIKSNEKFGYTANQSMDAIRILTQQTGDAGKAVGYMGVAADLAAAKHESLETAATQLAKTLSGGTKVLKEFGISAEKAADNSKQLEAAQKSAQVADDAEAKAKQHLADVHALLAGKTKLTTSETIQLRDANAAVTTSTEKATEAHKKLDSMHRQLTTSAAAAADNVGQLAAKLDGQAAAASDTFAGKLTAMKTRVEDMAASLGTKLGPALTVGGTALTGLASGMTVASNILGHFKTAQEAGKVATEGMTVATEAGTVATDAATVSEGLALLPILAITAAVVAVGVGIYELWNNWSTVWGWIKGAAEAVWNWIKNNWPLLLGILTGPIGLAVVEIIRHWDDIKDGFTQVKDWIGDRIDDIVSFFEGLPGRISRAVAHAFDGLTSAFGNAVKGMLNSVPGGGIVSSVLGHLPGFAAGGPISAGQLSIVGENGPELFLPGQSGTIVPNGALGGGNVSVGSIVINGASDPQAVAVAVRSEILRLKRSNVNGGLN